MPPLAIAGVGLALGAGGSYLSSRSNRRAADRASDTQLRVAETNNALASNIYNQNAATLSPFVMRGNAAGGALNDLLGLTVQAPQGTPQPPPQAWNPGAPDMGMTWEQAQGYAAQNPWQHRNALLGAEYMNDNGQPTPTAPMPYPAGQPSAADGFRRFIENSDYGFQFGEGANRVNSGYAGAGMLQSGAAMRDLERFRQNLQSGYRGEYTNLLANQQGVGLGAASAQAGVGQNYVNTVSANNQNAGDAAANAALLRGQNNPFANALSLFGGGLAGYGGF